MKKVIDFLIMAAFGASLFLDCKGMAYAERGYSAIGGEALVPVMLFVAWVLIKDSWKTHKEKEARKMARAKRLAQMRHELLEEI